MLKKAVFSKPVEAAHVRMVLTPCAIRGRQAVQASLYQTDNKVLHKNYDLADENTAGELLARMDGWLQADLFTDAGQCEFKRSRSGNTMLSGAQQLDKALNAQEGSPEQPAHNRVKDYLLTGEEPFLQALGISDSSGRVHDKKQAKFRQINRFLEYVRDASKELPAEGPLQICDLCCGKSYLSFAVYHYFANILHRDVTMTGVDLKKDVIAYCNEVAAKAGFAGLRFIAADVSAYEPDGHVHMVVSLHACDTATDLVLHKGVFWSADVILSTPCCHHELNRTLNCRELEFLSGYSMLRQKFCEAATDALRLKYLESNGYSVEALELVDPEETPKNILLRAVRSRKFDPASLKRRRAQEQFEAARAFLLGQREDRS